MCTNASVDAEGPAAGYACVVPAAGCCVAKALDQEVVQAIHILCLADGCAGVGVVGKISGLIPL